MMPWPGAGTQTSAGSAAEIRAACCRRRRPAAARTSASILARVELAQPRVEIAANRAGTGRPETAASAARSAGRCSCRCAARGPSARIDVLDSVDAAATARQHHRVARILARQHGADASGRRAAPPACPCCCARPGRSRRRAARPRSPSRTAACRRSRTSGASASRSPDVLMTTISQSTPACVCSSAATVLA